MANASARRVRNRLKYLSRLAREDPEAFEREWDKRLESAAGEAAYRARTLRATQGRRMGTAFEVVDQTLELLAACGGAKLPEGGEGPALGRVTREVLGDAAAQAVAGAFDSRLAKRGAGGRKCT